MQKILIPIFLISLTLVTIYILIYGENGFFARETKLIEMEERAQEFQRAQQVLQQNKD